jgi:hypothetical protein
MLLMTYQSAERLAENAKGDIKPKRLKKSGGLVTTHLYDKPIIDYLDQDEQPHYLLKNESKGFRIIYPDRNKEETPHHNYSGRNYFLVTDKRVVYVAGDSSGDEMMTFDYDEVFDLRYTGKKLKGYSIFLEANDGTEYKFHTRDNDIGDAKRYIQELLREKEYEGGYELSEEERERTEKLAEDADSKTVTPSRLFDYGRDYLNKPIINYLDEGESVEYIFKDEAAKENPSRERENKIGVGIGDANGNQHEIDRGWANRSTAYVFTDSRVLMILPREDEDEVADIEYSNISEDGGSIIYMDDRPADKIVLVAKSGDSFHLWLPRSPGKVFVTTRREQRVATRGDQRESTLYLLEKVHPDCKYALSSSAVEGLLTIPEKDAEIIDEDVYQTQLIDLLVTEEYVRMVTGDPEGDKIYKKSDSGQVMERRFKNMKFVDMLESGLKFGTDSRTYRVELGDGIPGLKEKVEEAGGFIREQIKETESTKETETSVRNNASDAISELRSGDLLSDADLSEEEMQKLGSKLSTAAGFLQDKVSEMRGSDEDPIQRLKELSELKEQGVISEEEFREKKQELLEEI